MRRALHHSAIRFFAGIVLPLSLFATVEAKSLRICTEGVPEGLDPAPYTSATTFDASSRTLYNRLVEFRRGTTEIIPGLATHWEVSGDGLEYVFHLRHGIRFHTTAYFRPGRDFNARDVLFSINRQRLHDHPWHNYAGERSWRYFQGLGMSDLIADIEAIDDLTVRIVLTRPFAPFLANLAMDFASILSAEYAGRLEQEDQKHLLNTMPVGTGPFQLVAFNEGEGLHFAAHDDYWAGRQPIDDLLFIIEPDNQLRRDKLLAGDCHVSSYPDSRDREVLRSKHNIIVQDQVNLDIAFLALNTRIPPFDSPRVRLALNMAINKQAIVDEIFRGDAGVVATGPLPASMRRSKRASDDIYDPETARALLQADGVRSFDMEVWILPHHRSYNPDFRRTAELIRDDFARVGGQVKIVTFDRNDYFTRSRALDRKAALLLGWVSDNGDPDNILSNLLTCKSVGGANRSQWCNQGFDEAVSEAQRATSTKTREDLYRQALEIFHREMPFLPLTHSRSFVALSGTVTQFVTTPFGGHWFEGVDRQDD